VGVQSSVTVLVKAIADLVLAVHLITELNNHLVFNSYQLQCRDIANNPVNGDCSKLSLVLASDVLARFKRAIEQKSRPQTGPPRLATIIQLPLSA